MNPGNGHNGSSGRKLDHANSPAEIEVVAARRTSGAGSSHASAEWMLGLTLLTVCCALTVSNAMHQQFMFGSDQLTIPSFVEDVLRNPHFTPFTWIIPRATYAFPDLAGYFLVRLVTGDAYVALTIYSILHVVASLLPLSCCSIVPFRIGARRGLQF